MAMTIENAHKHVPLMFQAQTHGRCQIQRIRDGVSQAPQWADEWVDKAYPELPTLPENVRSRDYTINWRLITNAGMDDSAIRPVIGARGWPYYPGSSMKGIFRRACTKDQAATYCGATVKKNDFRPGALRFHGGYPIGTNWTKGLVDIVHPQQGWQVEDQSKKSAAFAQISLYKPTLRFGISSTDPDTDWDEVWAIWEKAIAMGLGSRVCAGYGHVETSGKATGERILYSTRLKGQGQAAKLLNGEAEFRPNVFRAGLRGHALRIFGGLTDERTAVQLVEELFGGVSGKGVVGLVGLRFQESSLVMPKFQAGTAYEQTGYEVEGELKLLLTRELTDAEQTAGQEAVLKKLMAQLMQFGMVLGGFGKSWRRADHRLFFEEYYDRHKPLIGCHWQWQGDRALVMDVQVRTLAHLGPFVEKLRQTAQDWMQLRGVVPSPNRSADWREAWHPGQVQVWGTANREECEAVRWLHGAYAPRSGPGQPEGSIYASQSKALTGRVGQVGRLWHRMYPRVGLAKDPANPKKQKPGVPSGYLELLTIFPDDSRETRQFLEFLESKPFGFERLWGD
jgi:CRISPR-associated protein Cmr6